MRRLITITMLGATLLVGAVSQAAGGSRAPASTIPACEEILSPHQAAVAMGNDKAAVVGRAVVYGSTRQCNYVGANTGSVLHHSMLVEWGPYLERRKSMASFEAEICPVSKAACRMLAKAALVQPNTKSFQGVALALAQVGTIRWVHSSLFDYKPTFTWTPTGDLTPLDQLAWVLMYDPKTASLLEVLCTDNTTKTADSPCAVAAAWRAEDNLA